MRLARSVVPDVADDLRLARGGLRFADEATEASFRTWQILESVPFNRIGMIASVVGWSAAWTGSAFAIEGSAFALAPWILGVSFPAFVLGYLITFRPRRWLPHVTAVVNIVSGFVAVLLTFRVVGFVEASSLAVTVIAFFGFTVFRLPPGLAAPSVFSYVFLHQVLVLQSYAAGDLGDAETAVNSVMPWVAYGTALLTCCVLSQVSHASFRSSRVIDRQRELLAAERERSERLLRNVLPDLIAERLKASDDVIADHFEELTVLFVDIVGFTPLAATMEPPEVVGMLDRVFTSFDALTAARGLEKIKTIGDAYMVVGGVPEARPDHLQAIADLAIDMRDEIGRLTLSTGRPLGYRIGLATGPAVAGVIGRSKFAYDLWGHTVNMAARMESHGVRGRIQVTPEAASGLAATHLLEPRGTVSVKGVGDLETWFLLRRRDLLEPVAERLAESVP